MTQSRTFRRSRKQGFRGGCPLPAECGREDALLHKETLCEDLARIDILLGKLRKRRRIGPDVSSDDLLELFMEERERLFAQLRRLDALMLEDDHDNEDPLESAREIESRRRALACAEPVDFR